MYLFIGLGLIIAFLLGNYYGSETTRNLFMDNCFSSFASKEEMKIEINKRKAIIEVKSIEVLKDDK